MSAHRLFMTLALTAFFAGSAFAADNPPVGPWTVGPIKAKSSSGLGYCSMKNSFGDGTTLVFARDVSGSNSLALDFGKKMMTAGGQYTLILDVGMLSRQIVAVAATNNVLIAQLGQDQPFFDMLRHKDILQASFDQQSMSFGLDGTSDALTSLGSCVEDVKNGKNPDTANIGLTPQPAEIKSPAEQAGMSIGQQAMNSTMRDELERLRLENRKLMLENEALSREANATPVEPEQSPEVKQAIDDQKKLQAENAKLKEEVKKKQPPKKEVKEVADVKDKKDTKKTPDKDDKSSEAKPSEVKSAEDKPKPKKEGDDLLIRLLKAAEIPAMLSGVSNGAQVYTWQSGDIKGAAVDEESAPDHTISSAATQYISRAEQGCQGDFAHKLGNVTRLKNAEMMTGEIACMDGQTDEAGAILFISDDDSGAAIMLSSKPDGVEAALAQRDVLAQKLKDIGK